MKIWMKQGNKGRVSGVRRVAAFVLTKTRINEDCERKYWSNFWKGRQKKTPHEYCFSSSIEATRY